MTTIKNLKTYGLAESIYRSGYPMMTGEPADFLDPERIKGTSMTRASRLAGVANGSGHANFLKGIIVQFDLKYPQYLSPQLQRYHWFEIISSQSKMHCLTKGEFSFNEYVDNKVIDNLQLRIDQYNFYNSYENFMKCISNVPAGLEMWMGITTNYLQLKTIYMQRKNHKLKEDYGAIMAMIKDLPMGEELIIGNN